MLTPLRRCLLFIAITSVVTTILYTFCQVFHAETTSDKITAVCFVIIAAGIGVPLLAAISWHYRRRFGGW